MSDSSRFDLIRGQAPAKAALLFSAQLALASSNEISLWEGVANTSSYLWLVSKPTQATDKVIAQAPDRVNVNQTFNLRELQKWTTPDRSKYSVANFVLRVITHSSVAELRPQIVTQMEKVWGQPGCQRCSLSQVAGLPNYLLGVTYWATLQTFEDYKNWASSHPWRDVISSNTLEVPLRMLSRQINWLQTDQRH
jgi:hypothetical protein